MPRTPCTGCAIPSRWRPRRKFAIQIASTLAWIVVQQLIFHERFGFRVPLLSILRGNNSVKGMIRENKLPQIESAIQLGKSDGMFSMERYLKEYLTSKDSFYPPAENFKPSEEASREVIYHSPLLDWDTEPAAPKPKKASADEKSPSSSSIPRTMRKNTS